MILAFVTAVLAACVACTAATDVAQDEPSCGGDFPERPAVEPTLMTGQVLADMRTGPYVYAVLMTGDGEQSAAAAAAGPQLAAALREAGVELVAVRTGAAGTPVEHLFAKRSTVPPPALFLYEDAAEGAAQARPSLLSPTFVTAGRWEAEAAARLQRLELEPPSDLCRGPGAIARRLLKRGAAAPAADQPPSTDEDDAEPENLDEL